jgi:competence/damage-inducible protein CinA-like protein
MNVEVVSIGNELLRGFTVDTNAAFIGRELFERGYDVSRHVMIPDDPHHLDKELRASLARSSVVIATGGLGPTIDDHTRQIVAALFGSKFHFDKTLAADLARRYGEDFPTIQNQATVPQDAILLPNTIGTAPGFVFSKDSKLLILLPGVPQEMKPMFLRYALPILEKHIPKYHVKHAHYIHFCLMGEHELDPLMRRWKEREPELDLGVYPSYDTLTLYLNAPTEEALHPILSEIDEKFKMHLLPFGVRHSEEAVNAWLTENKQTLSIAESCTGGRIAAKLTSVPGASHGFLGGFVVYSNALKQEILGVSEATLQAHGAVSSQTVKEMLAGVFLRTGADFGIAVSGIAGPTGGTEEKPVGTVFIALGKQGEVPEVIELHLKGERESVIELATNRALGSFWRKIAHLA